MVLEAIQRAFSYLCCFHLWTQKATCERSTEYLSNSLWVDSLVICSTLRKATWNFWEAWENPQSKIPAQYTVLNSLTCQKLWSFNHPEEKAALSSKRALEVVHERLRWNESFAEKNSALPSKKKKKFFFNQNILFYITLYVNYRKPRSHHKRPGLHFNFNKINLSWAFLVYRNVAIFINEIVVEFSCPSSE